MYSKSISIAACALILFTGCSSAPKRPPEVFVNRNASTGQLDLGNQAVSKGDYPTAHLFMKEAWRLAVSTDDPDSRIKVHLAEGNAYFNEGKRDKARESWTRAMKEAEDIHNATLISLGKIYLARGTLAEGSSLDLFSLEERKKFAQEAKDTTLQEMGNVKSNQLYAAFAWKVIGLSEKEMGNWEAAEVAIKKAAEIHEKSQYLEDAAYDWYLIASIRSKAAQYTSAIAALNVAITFDRRAENTNGLGMNWMAIGSIEEKNGNTDKAIEAYLRSADIFKSGFLTQNATEAEKKVASLTKEASTTKDQQIDK